MLFAQVEPAPGGYVGAADLALKHAEAHPDVFFPILAICGPVLVGLAFIYASVKWGLPFVEKQLDAFRAHTAALLTQRGTDASQDLAAARELAKEQHLSIVSKIGDEVSHHTGEIAKLHEKSDRHGELLRSIVVKVGAAVLLLLLTLSAVRSAYLLAIAVPACKCDPPCASGQRCTCDGCKEIKTTTTTASRPQSALGLDMYANVANYSCTVTSSSCF